MIALLIALPLLAPAPPLAVAPAPNFLYVQKKEKQEEGEADKPKPPTKEVIEGVLAELKTAFSKGDDLDAQFAAIDGCTAAPCEEVAEELCKLLKHPEIEIIKRMLPQLAKLDFPDVLPALLKFQKKDSRLKKDDKLMADVLKTIAWHNDPKTIDLFTKDIFKSKSDAIVQAKILSLGKIRSNDSAEALIKLIKSASRKNVKPKMERISMALTVLVGENDNGKSIDNWTSWWNENKRDLEVAPELPKLPAATTRKWNKYWGIAEKRKPAKIPPR